MRVSEIERLGNLLSENGLVLRGVTLGSNPSATAEERAKQIRESIQRMISKGAFNDPTL